MCSRSSCLSPYLWFAFSALWALSMTPDRSFLHTVLTTVWRHRRVGWWQWRQLQLYGGWPAFDCGASWLFDSFLRLLGVPKTKVVLEADPDPWLVIQANSVALRSPNYPSTAALKFHNTYCHCRGMDCFFWTDWIFFPFYISKTCTVACPCSTSQVANTTCTEALHKAYIPELFPADQAILCMWPSCNHLLFF